MKPSVPHPNRLTRRSQKQQGISLVMVLLFLVILTLVGIAASTMSLSSERMARNSRDQNIALQAAEAALRYARLDVKTRVSGPIGASATCDVPGYKGVCLPASQVTDQQVWDLYLEDPARSVEIGEIPVAAAAGSTQPVATLPTAATAKANGVSKQPRYVIEAVPDLDNGDEIPVGGVPYVYRITALGFGANANTKVMVQEVVRF